MKIIVLVFGCVLLVVVGFAQERGGLASQEGAAARVMGAPLSHPVTAWTGGVRVELRGVYMCDGLLWLAFAASNRSAIDFRGNAVRVEMRGRKAFKRRACQELGLRVVWRGEPGVLKADSTVRFCVAMVPRVPGKEQEIFIQWVERDGDRRVVMRVRGKRVLRARRV
jgi:hypothetical protein